VKVRALALGLLVLALVSLAGCPTLAAPLPDDLVCRHCACWSAARTASAPVLCSSLGRDLACCLADSS
jgi:hypothetical protein